MAATIDMKTMRYINLFSKISGVSTTKCFNYNGQIIFVVPKSLVSKAIGRDASNIKKLREILGRKVRVLPSPVLEDKVSISKFVEEVVSPVEFNKIEVREGNIVITAGRQSKAALIGRNRQREKELLDLLKNHFGVKSLRIA